MSILEIRLYGAKAAGRVAIIDADDYDLVSPYRWRVRERLRPGGRIWGPYAVTSLPIKMPSAACYGMHQLITGWPLVDHVSGDGLYNRRSNLRPATVAQNSQNRRPYPGGSSRFKGVCWNSKSGKWQAGIKINRRSCHLGLFVSEEDAARAYDKAAREVFGEYAYLNFPEVA
jgi:hypothetical protein